MKILLNIFCLYILTVNALESFRICNNQELKHFECVCSDGNSMIFCEIQQNNDAFTENNTEWLGFRNEPNVTKLNFEGNNNFIPTHIFNHTRMVHTLFIKYWNLGTLQPFAFRYLSKLKKVILNYDKITSVARDAFSNHPELELIDLESNAIRQIQKGAFVNLLKLEEINLCNNRLTVLPKKVFKSLISLKRIYLHSNQLVKFQQNLIRPIINNFYRSDAELGFEANPLKCDEDLLWFFDLYNRTASQKLKDELVTVECVQNNTEIFVKLFELNPLDLSGK